MLPATISTNDLCAATGYSKPALVDLEKAGVIGRKARDQWPTDTLKKIVAHLRDKVRRGPKSEAEMKFIASKAALNEQRIEREAGRLLPTAAVEHYVNDVVGLVRAEHCQLPAQFTRDLGTRARLQRLVDDMDRRVSDRLESAGDEMWEAALKAGRKRT